jgi:hypothetical protein
LPTGHLVFANGGALFAVPFDLRHLTVTGGQFPISKAGGERLQPAQRSSVCPTTVR